MGQAQGGEVGGRGRAGPIAGAHGLVELVGEGPAQASDELLGAPQGPRRGVLPQLAIDAGAQPLEQFVAPSLDLGPVLGDDVVEAAALKQAPGVGDRGHALGQPAARLRCRRGRPQRARLARVRAIALGRTLPRGPPRRRGIAGEVWSVALEHASHVAFSGLARGEAARLDLLEGVGLAERRNLARGLEDGLEHLEADAVAAIGGELAPRQLGDGADEGRQRLAGLIAVDQPGGEVVSSSSPGTEFGAGVDQQRGKVAHALGQLGLREHRELGHVFDQVKLGDGPPARRGLGDGPGQGTHAVGQRGAVWRARRVGHGAQRDDDPVALAPGPVGLEDRPELDQQPLLDPGEDRR